MVLAVTGGGASAIGRLLAVPGASRTVLEALVPYSAPSLDQLLGAVPEQYCSERTARAMAMAAFWRARHWMSELASRERTSANGEATTGAPSTDILAGIGATASLASDRPKRGPHRAHIALQTADYTLVRTLHLSATLRPRHEEDELLSETMIRMIASAAGVEPFIPPPLSAEDSLDERRTDSQPAWRELLLGHCRRVCWDGAEPSDTPRVIFPGAFNPMHDGHCQMARLAAEQLGTDVAFELSIENVDKPPLDYAEIERRGRDITGHGRLWLTRAPTFLEKARLFPGATFVVGADTIVRIADPKYYGHNASACAAALAELAQLGNRFLVFGRRSGDEFLTLEQLALPDTLRTLCDGVSRDRFRADVSSTELRRGE